MTTDMALWQAINAYDLDAADAVLPFIRRLARDRDWSTTHAQAVVAEYKRFIYLTCISATVLTPSDDVDEAWHLHLIYTRDYWDRFCSEVLGRKIHHGPTQGGAAEDMKYHDAYARTLELYESEFGTPPPAIWPDPARRFQPRTSNVIRLPKRQVFLSLAAAGSLALAGCAMDQVSAYGQGVLAWLCVAVIAVAVFLLNAQRIVARGFMGFALLAGFLSVAGGFLLTPQIARLLTGLAGQKVDETIAAAVTVLMAFVLAVALHGASGKGGSGCGSSGGADSSGCGGGCGGD